MPSCNQSGPDRQAIAVGCVISNNHQLRELTSVLKQREAITKRVRNLLPDEIATHLVFATLQGEELYLYTISSAWANKLRFFSHRLRNIFPEIKKIHIKVAPNASKSYNSPILKTQPTPLRIITPQIAQHMQDVAQKITNPNLSAALLRLAGHTRNIGSSRQPILPPS